jgi:hypothetical protein
MALTRTAKIANIEEQIAQLEQQKKNLIQAQKTQDQKDRTRRLIQRGAILESLIADAPTLTNEQIKAFLEKTVTSDYAKRQLAAITAQSAPPQVKTPESKAVPSAETAPKLADNGAKQSNAPSAQNAAKPVN